MGWEEELITEDPQKGVISLSLFEPMYINIVMILFFSTQALELVKTAQLSKLQSNGDSEVVTDPLKVFHQAIENSKPIMGTTGVRRGGKLYHVSGSRYTV